jgi:hypothetical protein
VVDDAVLSKPPASSSVADPMVLLQSEAHRLEEAVYKYSATAAVGYAKLCTDTLILDYPPDRELSLDFFGSMTQLLTFVNFSLSNAATTTSTTSTTTSLEGTVAETPALKTIKSKLLDTIRSSSLRAHGSASASASATASATTSVVGGGGGGEDGGLCGKLVKFALAQLKADHAEAERTEPLRPTRAVMKVIEVGAERCTQP